MDLKELIEKISKESGIKIEDIQKKVKEKKLEFSGLISEEGAAHIVAKELGISLLKKERKQLKIENIISDMSSVDVVGKVVKILGIRDFQRGEEIGKVANILLGDETGAIRMSLWNEQAELVEKDKIKEGDVIEIRGGYTKKDNLDNVELRAGKRGQIIKSQEKLPELGELKITSIIPEVKNNIKEIKPGVNASVRGSLVQIFEGNIFYSICPECKKSVDEECEEHGKVSPEKAMIISGILDDGTGNIRIVFFRDLAEKLIDMKTNEAFELSEEGKNLSNLYERFRKNLGKEFYVEGRAKTNQFFERVELIVNNVKEVEPLDIIKESISKLV